MHALMVARKSPSISYLEGDFQLGVDAGLSASKRVEFGSGCVKRDVCGRMLRRLASGEYGEVGLLLAGGKGADV